MYRGAAEEVRCNKTAGFESELFFFWLKYLEATYYLSWLPIYIYTSTYLPIYPSTHLPLPIFQTFALFPLVVAAAYFSNLL